MGRADEGDDVRETGAVGGNKGRGTGGVQRLLWGVRRKVGSVGGGISVKKSGKTINYNYNQIPLKIKEGQFFLCLWI